LNTTTNIEEIIVEMKNICKNFPGVKALNNVNFSLRRGETQALIGENGAGKSTLAKILAGIYQKDSGEILFRGKIGHINNPIIANKLGIGIIHQESQLFPSLSIAENICMGRLPNKSIFVDNYKLIQSTQELCEKLRINISVQTPLSKLSIGEKQLIMFARILFFNPLVIIMDEPTSSLTIKEKNLFFNIINLLKKRRISIIYVSHDLEEIFEISDRTTVLRDGKKVATLNTKETDVKSITKLMVGRELGKSFSRGTQKRFREMLRVEHLTRKGAFENITFNVKGGEVLGFAGLIGSGRSEVARVIFGIDPIDSGTIYISGKAVQISSPRDAIAQKIAFVPEDRHEALVLMLSVLENITLPSLKEMSKRGIINGSKRILASQNIVKKLSISTPSLNHLIRNLSGGNQQKVVFARWLLKYAEIYILDEPTRGIDVGAKEEIYKIIRFLANQGKAVIVISSEIEEILGISDRIEIVARGKIAGELSHEEATKEKIVKFMMEADV